MTKSAGSPLHPKARAGRLVDGEVASIEWQWLQVSLWQ